MYRVKNIYNYSFVTICNFGKDILLKVKESTFELKLSQKENLVEQHAV